MIAPVRNRESLDNKKMYLSLRDEQLSLCIVLEEIADSLPERVDAAVCKHVAKTLPLIIEGAHRYEEDVIFPLLEKSKISSVDLKTTIKRLKIEHLGDKCFAEELSEVLASYGKGMPNLAAEATGYMLRGFFEALRRHIAFEAELFANVFDFEF